MKRKPYKPLYEIRRNPDLNPHIGAWDYLEQYKDDPDVYISFTEVDKIGINPQSKYNTPVGIYTYPLKEFYITYIRGSLGGIQDISMKPRTGSENKWDNIKVTKSLGDFAPFAGNSKYINFIRLKDKSNFIEDMYTDYGSSDFNKDIVILFKKYGNILHGEIRHKSKSNIPWLGNKKTPDDVWNNFIDYAIRTSDFNHPVRHIWNVTKLLASELAKSDKQVSTKWNLILSKDLGYSGLADKSGKKFIHGGEPMQAVFLRTSAFEVLHRVENKPAKNINKDIKLNIGNKYKNKEGDTIEIINFDATGSNVKYKIIYYRKEKNDTWDSLLDQDILLDKLNYKGFKKI